MVNKINASDAVLHQIGEEHNNANIDSNVTIVQLRKILPVLTGGYDSNVTHYHEYIDDSSNTFDINATRGQVQAMIDDINKSQAAVKTITATTGTGPGSVVAALKNLQLKDVNSTAAKYKQYLQNHPTLAGNPTTAGLQTMVNKINASDAVLHQIGEEHNNANIDSNVTIVQLRKILPVLTGGYDSNVTHYHEYIDDSSNTFDINATRGQVQAMIDDINKSQAAVKTITATTGTGPGSVVAALKNLQLKDVNSTAAKYKQYLQNHPALANNPTKAGLQAMVNKINTSDAVLHQIGEEHHDTSTKSTVTIAQLQNILPVLTGGYDSNVTHYHEYIDDSSNTFDINATRDQVQAMIDDINKSQASNNILSKIETEAKTKAGTVTTPELKSILSTLTEVNSTNIAQYNDYIKNNPTNLFTTPVARDKVQQMIDEVNKLTDPKWFSDSNITDTNMSSYIVSYRDDDLNISIKKSLGGQEKLLVKIPYATKGNSQPHIKAFKSAPFPISGATSSNEINATLEWAEQDLNTSGGTFDAYITVSDEYISKQEDNTSDVNGTIVFKFLYPAGNGKIGRLTLKIIPGIPDRNFYTATNGKLEHRFVYRPVISESGRVWLNNNLGADYSNVDSPKFDPKKQATKKDDRHAYGSLFQ